MSSPIGGNGGNGGFNLFDPLGLGGIVQGLVGGLAGEVGKLVNGPDNSCIAQVGQQLLNKVGSFDGASAAGSTGAGVGQDPAATEFTPAKDPSVAQDGYQPAPEPAQMQQSEAPGVDFAPDEAPAGGERGQSQSAATAAHGSSTPQAAQNEEELNALQALMASANAIDHYGVAGDANDGLFNRDSLTRVAGDSGLPQELRDAAQYVLDHPKMMMALQIATGRGDGSISTSQLSAYAARLLNAPAQTQGPASGPAPQGAAQQNTGGNVGIHNVQSQTPTQGSASPNPTAGAHGAPPPGRTQEDTGLNGIVNRLDSRLDNLQGEIDAQAKVLEDPNASDAAIRAAQTKMTQLSQKMQMIMEQRKAMFELISNLAKAFNDMQMVAIRHIG